MFSLGSVKVGAAEFADGPAVGCKQEEGKIVSAGKPIKMVLPYAREWEGPVSGGC